MHPRPLSFFRIHPPPERAGLALSLRVYVMARWGPGGGPPASAGPDIEGRGPPRDGPIALETPAADSRRAKTRRLFAQLYCPRALLLIIMLALAYSRMVRPPPLPPEHMPSRPARTLTPSPPNARLRWRSPHQKSRRPLRLPPRPLRTRLGFCRRSRPPWRRLHRLLEQLWGGPPRSGASPA